MARKNWKTLHDDLMTAVEADPARKVRYERERLAADLITALSDLRESLEVTQTSLAETMDVSQENISRIERQHDLYLSTLRRYVEALGGHLEVIAVFPERRVSLLRPGEPDRKAEGF
jgi:DNA-binding XRE family transcriptional regulator